jgi:regulator of RNase E activity RraA
MFAFQNMAGSRAKIEGLRLTPFNYKSKMDTKETPGRELLRDIHAYTAVTGSATTVEAMGERIRALFHRQLLTVAGFSSVLTLASGPIQHDGEDFYGRVVTVRLVLQSA